MLPTRCSATSKERPVSARYAAELAFVQALLDHVASRSDEDRELDEQEDRP
jgi:hypothetical protein